MATSAGGSKKRSKAERPTLGSASREVILIEIGPDRVKYYVLKAFLTHYSQYFNKSLNGPWKEAEDRKIALPDVEPTVFNIFVNWLYTQAMPKSRSAWFRVSELSWNPYETTKDLDLLMIKAYIFGDRFATPRFSQLVLDQFASHNICNGDTPWYSNIIYAYDNLSASNVMLKLLVDLHSHFWDVDHDDEKEPDGIQDQLPRAFLLSVMRKQTKMISDLEDKSAKEHLTACSYHEHATDEGRKECQKRIKDSQCIYCEENSASESDEDE
ncbi:hypothetical protein BDV96DRAFT_597678 [Lophiotrema nucula]|uniref:BTB domain-containing protein n=1 Tax=Lophiotrema nucula TaxID=690887 RepID=A0A6A5ZFB6_9PLEO|nr:hypothetical protein BDV96DRAFT_597678 [Lophiotrema nucula]